MKKLLSIVLASVINLFATTQTMGGISWLENEPSGYFSWQDANSWCTNQGYRLPTISELTSVWVANGSTPSPIGFKKDTFYWASDVTSSGHQGCSMDYDCSENSVSSSGIPDTGNGHPKCVIDSSTASSSVSSNVNQSSSSSSIPTVTTPTMNAPTTISLNIGWNLISIPGNVEVSTLFTSGDIIYKYINNEWKLYDGKIKTFSKINVGEGFWVKAPTSRTQSVSLTQVDSTKLTTLFGKDWNLIGMNKDVLKDNLTFNYSYIYTYNNSKWLSTSEITKLEKYKGYWIKFDQLITKLSDFYISNATDTIDTSTNKVPYISLTPINDTIEDELANAILKSQESITLMNITENKFTMGTSIDWRLDYYNMVKSYQQAASSLQELIDVHEKMEKSYTKRVLKSARAYKCDTNVDPYCIPEATHKKIDFYLDHFGETTPGGTKIDIKTIAQRTKQDISFISDLIKEKYSKVSAKESRDAAKWEHYENVATAVSNGADLITAVAGVGTGVKVLKGAVKYGIKKKATMTLFKNQLTKPSTMSTATYDTLRSKYLSTWSKEMGELAIKSKENILKGTWDFGSNVIGLYKAASGLGYVPESKYINVTDGIFNIANFAKDGKIIDGLKSLMVISNAVDATKKDILFVSNTLAKEFSYSTNEDTKNLNKNMVEILYDENGNLKVSLQKLTQTDEKNIAAELNTKTMDKGLQEGIYSYLDENNNQQTKLISNNIDLNNVDKEYHKNKINNGDSEFAVIKSSSSSSSSSSVSSSNTSSSSSSSISSSSSASSNSSIQLSNVNPIYACQNEKQYEYYSNGNIKVEYCVYDKNERYEAFYYGNNIVGKRKKYYENGRLATEDNYVIAVDNDGRIRTLRHGLLKEWSDTGILGAKINYAIVKNDDNNWKSIFAEGVQDKHHLYVKIETNTYKHFKVSGVWGAYKVGPFTQYYFSNGNKKLTGIYESKLGLSGYINSFFKGQVITYDEITGAIIKDDFYEEYSISDGAAYSSKPK